MALDYKLDRMADDALSEIRKMAEDAMPKEPDKPEPPQTKDALLALYQQQMLANETGRYFGYPGNAFSQQSGNPYFWQQWMANCGLR